MHATKYPRSRVIKAYGNPRPTNRCFARAGQARPCRQRIVVDPIAERSARFRERPRPTRIPIRLPNSAELRSTESNSFGSREPNTTPLNPVGPAHDPKVAGWECSNDLSNVSCALRRNAIAPLRLPTHRASDLSRAAEMATRSGTGAQTRANRRKCGLGRRRHLAAISRCKSEQTALLRGGVRDWLIALHTREVAGSKPAAPTQREARSGGFLHSSPLPRSPRAPARLAPQPRARRRASAVLADDCSTPPDVPLLGGLWEIARGLACPRVMRRWNRKASEIGIALGTSEPDGPPGMIGQDRTPLRRVLL